MNAHLTKEQMKDEIRTELQQGGEIESIKDSSGQWVDGYLPVYNNQIIEEWQQMPHEYTDRGSHDLGADETIGIIGRMSLDLYIYYSEIFFDAMDELEGEMASV